MCYGQEYNPKKDKVLPTKIKSEDWHKRNPAVSFNLFKSERFFVLTGRLRDVLLMTRIRMTRMHSCSTSPTGHSASLRIDGSGESRARFSDLLRCVAARDSSLDVTCNTLEH